MVKSLIICEGSTDKEFLEQMLKHLEISNQYIDISFLGRDSKNKSSIFKEEKWDTIKNEIGTIYKDLLIIFDSDYKKNDNKYGGFENSEKEIKLLIKKLGFNNLADYHIVCEPNKQDGYLESLILSTIPHKEKECIKSFIDCSRFKDKEKDKAILNKIYKLGYPDTPYDFSHKNFDELKSKINNLA
jgi:hypothetical protein